MHDFAERRPDHFREHLRAGFEEVTGSAELTISGIAGEEGVTLAGVDLHDGARGVRLRAGAWTGSLFTGIPVVIRAANLDLSGATLSGEFTLLSRTADELRFIMDGAVGVELRSSLREGS